MFSFADVFDLFAHELALACVDGDLPSRLSFRALFSVLPLWHRPSSACVEAPFITSPGRVPTSFTGNGCGFTRMSRRPPVSLVARRGQEGRTELAHERAVAVGAVRNRYQRGETMFDH
jgi:hypothetical protein